MTSDRQKHISIRHWQLPCCAGFAITDYRSQGRTFSDIIFDLESPTKIAGGHRIYTYTAVYVALSRCWPLKGLSFSTGNIFSTPDAALKDAMGRFTELDRLTGRLRRTPPWVGVDDMMKCK